MARYWVTNRRGQIGPTVSAEDAVKGEPGITTVVVSTPQMVAIEATEEDAERLRTMLQHTHCVEPQVRRSLH